MNSVNSVNRWEESDMTGTKNTALSKGTSCPASGTPISPESAPVMPGNPHDAPVNPKFNLENADELSEQSETETQRSRRGRRSKLEELPPEVYQRCLAYIRAGAYDHVAAAFPGITPRTFYNWLRRGKQAKSGKYFQFFQEIMKARAEAQVTAEVQVKRDNPEFWLTHGPAKADWRPQSEVSLHSQLDADELEKRRPAPLASLGKAFAILAEIGLTPDSEAGRKLIEQAREEDKPDVLDVQPLSREDGGEVEDRRLSFPTADE